MSVGVWVLLIAIAATTAIGLSWRAMQGRIRRSGGGVFEELPEGLRQRLSGEHARVTLLQLSTTFCAPCRHTRILLSDLADRTEGLRHVDVDLTDHPEWSTPLGVHTTPTTLALDSGGREIFRLSGVPKRERLLAALADHLATDPD